MRPPDDILVPRAAPAGDDRAPNPGRFALGSNAATTVLLDFDGEPSIVRPDPGVPDDSGGQGVSVQHMQDADRLRSA